MTNARVLDSYLGIDPTAWDNLVGPGSPFLEHTFLAALEAYGCAAPATGWTPRPIVVEREGALVGAAPGWVKAHSMGEFVYDHRWAQAAAANGISYYPKLVVAVPFTPATGSRLLVASGGDTVAVRRSLLAGIGEASRGTRGAHVLFGTAEESEWLATNGMFARLQYQFHWKNEGYQTFDDFLSTFTSKRRNTLRRERRDLAAFDIRAVTAPSGAELDAMHALYVRHTEQFGPWGRAYLSRDLFRHLGAVWGDRLHLVLARQHGEVVAGAFNVIKGDRLYGRYWGSAVDVPFLHFEVCYYRAIEACIERQIRVFEPGHGGEHKYRRGFEPTITWSNHALAEPRLHEALRAFSAEEAAYVRREVAELSAAATR